MANKGKNEMVKVSLIIPVYNVEEYLEECLDSAINQTLKDIEIIIVNDGSLDDSLSIIDRYRKIDKRIRVINQTNKGLAEARNNGIRMAKGEFLAFLDSDDYVDTKMLEKMYQTAVKDNSDIVECGLLRILKNGKIVARIQRANKCVCINKESIMDSYMKLDSCMKAELISHTACDKIYRRALFQDNNILYKNIYRSEDLATTIKPVYFAKKITVLSDCLYYWRGGHKHKQSLKSDYTIEHHIDDTFVALEEIKAFLKKKGIYKRYKKEYTAKYITKAFWVFKCSFGCPKLMEKTYKRIKASGYARVNRYRYADRFSREGFKVYIVICFLGFSIYRWLKTVRGKTLQLTGFR